MNKKQKICLWIGIAVIALMGLYPPWWNMLGYEIVSDAGYHFIFSPPPPLPEDDSPLGPALNSRRLCLQWTIVALITSSLILAFRHKKPEKCAEENKQVTLVAGDNCGSCGRKIDGPERAIMVDGQLVCTECELKLLTSQDEK